LRQPRQRLTATPVFRSPAVGGLHQGNGFVANLAGDLDVCGAVAAAFGDVKRPIAVRRDVRQFERRAGSCQGVAKAAGIHRVLAEWAREKIRVFGESRGVPGLKRGDHFRKLGADDAPGVDAVLRAAAKEKHVAFEPAGLFGFGIEAQAQEFRGAAAGELREEANPAKDFAAGLIEKETAKLVNDFRTGGGDVAGVAHVRLAAIARTTAGEVVEFQQAHADAKVYHVGEGDKFLVHGAVAGAEAVVSGFGGPGARWRRAGGQRIFAAAGRAWFRRR